MKRLEGPQHDFISSVVLLCSKRSKKTEVRGGFKKLIDLRFINYTTIDPTDEMKMKSCSCLVYSYSTI